MKKEHIVWYSTNITGSEYVALYIQPSHAWDSQYYTAANGVQFCGTVNAAQYDCVARVLLIPTTDPKPILIPTDFINTIEVSLSEYNFKQSEYADEYEIVRYSIPKSDEPYFWRNTFTDVDHHEAANVLVLERKCPIPTGE